MARVRQREEHPKEGIVARASRRLELELRNELLGRHRILQGSENDLSQAPKELSKRRVSRQVGS